MMYFCEHRCLPVQIFGILVSPPPPDLPVVHVSCPHGMHKFRFSDVMSYYSDVTMHLVLGKHVGFCLSILNEMIVMKIINYLVIYWCWKDNFDLATTRCRYNSLPSGLPLCVIPIFPEGLSSFPINFMISIFINRIMTRKKTRLSLNLRWLFFPIWYNDARHLVLNMIFNGSQLWM